MYVCVCVYVCVCACVCVAEREREEGEGHIYYAILKFLAVVKFSSTCNKKYARTAKPGNFDCQSHHNQDKETFRNF